MMLGGKHILVTGAASGIGAAAARVFTAHGARVACLDINADGAAEVAAVLPGAISARCDVSDPTSVAAAIDAVIAAFGRLDGAFNNAGIEQSRGRMMPLETIPLVDFDAVMAVNLRGLFICLQAELPRLSRPGAIVNTGSVMSAVAAPGLAAYAASKHGVMGLTRVAAVDHAALGIRVNAVLPGAVATPMILERAEAHAPGYAAAAAGFHPMGRVAAPEEIAEAAAWLISDRASFVTGAALAVDGGLTAV
ncbi:SDR family NAD(P)-dependent oxidoreductase [Polymorphobacter multimanifer]|nr:SDR family oxidoreductase [Polymorphobacter multimanifer]